MTHNPSTPQQGPSELGLRYDYGVVCIGHTQRAAETTMGLSTDTVTFPFEVIASKFHNDGREVLSTHRTREAAEAAARRASGTCTNKRGQPATCLCGGATVHET